MIDIAKCFGGDCPLKENCYRFTVRPVKDFQWYLIDPPYKDGKCNYYLPEDEDAANQVKIEESDQ